MRAPSASRSVPCDKCGAAVGQACRTRHGYTSFGTYHKARRQSVTPSVPTLSRDQIFAAITAERDRQDRIHPNTSQIPDGTGERWAWLEGFARKVAEHEVVIGRPTYATVLLEEVAEALAATTVADMRKELVEVAAVCVKWCEEIDRRERGA